MEKYSSKVIQKIVDLIGNVNKEINLLIIIKNFIEKCREIQMFANKGSFL